MILSPVVSTNIAAAGYDEANLLFEVQFRGGAKYQYKGVPKEIVEAVMRGPSPGRAFRTLVRDKYPFVKVPPVVTPPPLVG